MLKKLIAFYEAEKELLEKSKSFMKKIYKNRVDRNLGGEREVVIFLFDKIGYMYFGGKADKENVSKLLYGFETLLGKKALREAVENHLEFRKSNLK